MTNGYFVNGTEYSRWSDALAAAMEAHAEIYADGMRVWAPPAPVSAKKMREYQERRNAYLAAHKALKE